MGHNTFVKLLRLCTCFILLCTLFFLVTGCAGDKASQAPSSITDPTAESEPVLPGHLRISITPSDDYCHFTSDELGGNFSEGIGYNLMTDVSIEIGNRQMPLENALRDNLITEEEIFYAARQDARDGYCEESYESVNGLTNFTFSYPEYNLRLLYDIYESPSGKQRLISQMVLYDKRMILGPCHLFDDKETGELYDREDWGLSFEVVKTSPTGMTIRCTQSGGQQIGQLETMDFSLRANGFFLPKNEGSDSSLVLVIDFKPNDITEFSIDWTQAYGQLDSGNYQVMFVIKDVYDESQKHPLMRNFYDKQLYTVDFTVS